MTNAAIDQRPNPSVDRAIRLFQFLARAQQLKNPPVRTLDGYDTVIWLSNLPQHPAVHTPGATPGIDEPLLTIDRIHRADPPDPDPTLAAHINGLHDNPDVIPELANEDLRGPFQKWLLMWQPWADQERIDRPVRLLYAELFSLYKLATGAPEQLEFLVGTGCLAWTPPGHPSARRHMLTAPLTITFNAETGRIGILRAESMDALTVELDMLDPGLTTSPHIDDVRAAAAQFSAHPLDSEAVGTLARQLVHTLDPQGAYSPAMTAPAFSEHAEAAFAPALILRKRSQIGLVDVFRRIQTQLAAAGTVPAGIAPLIDPDYRPPVEGSATGADATEGALITVDDDAFLPLPVNDVQIRILQHVDAHAQTLVQGPPGTGKTHTAAALLSHLLAQGKRVLVTAHTDRALIEVRDKLPAAIKPLSVSVVGSSREEMNDLKTSVEHIVSVAAEHDAARAEDTIAKALAEIETLGLRRADLHRALLDGRQDELREYAHAGYTGTLGSIAQQLFAQTETYSWVLAYATPTAEQVEPPVAEAALLEWAGYLTDPALADDEPAGRMRIPAPGTVPDARGLADLMTAERAAATREAQSQALRAHPAYAPIGRLDVPTRDDLRATLYRFADALDDLTRRREAWMDDALGDVRVGRGGIWASRSRSIGELISRAEPPVRWLGPRVDIQVTMADLGLLGAWARELKDYLASGATFKLEQGSPPRVGAFAPREVKTALTFFDHVRIDRAIPTTEAQLTMFLAWSDAALTIGALDRAWPDIVRVPAEDTLHERLEWHKAEFAQLGRVLDLGAQLDAETARLARLGLPRPDWGNVEAIRAYAQVVDAVAVGDAASTAAGPLQRIDAVLAAEAQWQDAEPCVAVLLAAVRQRDPNAYAPAYQRLWRLWDVRRMVGRRDAIGAAIEAMSPALGATAGRSAIDGFDAAWRWAATGAWLRTWTATSNVNTLQDEVIRTEEQIRAEVETLAATRAWKHALSEDRLTGRARANLTQYAQLVSSLGKGTGKYADRRRVDIRQALDRCRPSVPVWIMPIYRIAEQFAVQPDMFDIVIVDEASQAGLEGTFLQYLAPKMIVIGDDKQVSPTAVGVDQQQLRDLARQYLADDTYRASWEDPQRSLFDEAKMRYSGMLTLVEHRRCVPEIIGFSNRVAYEPEGIKLVPVRQYGADRLEPIKVVHVADGATKGTTNRVNQREVDAIVDQIVKCIADPRYDGMTFGVISLLGPAQATVIEHALLERVPASEWQARDLRCGDSNDFQGSERNVIFLSMVAAPEPGKRPLPLTANRYVQRYNVAASRAKDQMWLFHTLSLSDVGSPDDMRFALLDYCYGVVGREAAPSPVVAAVPDGTRVAPFDSLFEQRVYNEIVGRGYEVVPQFEAQGYRIDLVVIGAKGRLAVECDGDAWHGPDAYERDLARQRDLERCGWEFFRIRETEFYVDRDSVLQQLWDVLDELDIHPVGWEPPAPDLDVVINPSTVDPSDPGSASADSSRADLVGTDSVGTESVGTQSVGTGSSTVEPAGLLPSPVAASRAQVIEGLTGILAAGGPMSGARLSSLYVRAAGLRKSTKSIGELLAAAIADAVGQGQVVADDPLAEGTPAYRLPDQDPSLVRPLGTRTFDDIPPAELATLLTVAARSQGWDREEVLFRAVLEQLGLKRLTAGISERLRQVLPLARDAGVAAAPTVSAADGRSIADVAGRERPTVSVPAGALPSGALPSSDMLIGGVPAGRAPIGDAAAVDAPVGGATVAVPTSPDVTVAVPASPVPTSPDVTVAVPASPVPASPVPTSSDVTVAVPASAGATVADGSVQAPVTRAAASAPVPGGAAGRSPGTVYRSGGTALAMSSAQAAALVGAVQRSAMYRAQQARHGRQLDDATVGTALIAMLTTNSGDSLSGSARALNISATSALDVVTKLRQILNVNGTAVLTVIDAGRQIVVDVPLLREQFEIAG